MTSTPTPKSPMQMGASVILYSLHGERDLGIGDLGSLRGLIDSFSSRENSMVNLESPWALGPEFDLNHSISSFAFEVLALEITSEKIPGLAQSDFEKVISSDIYKRIANEPLISYPLVRFLKENLLKMALVRFQKEVEFEELRKSLKSFCKEQKEWLPNFALFRFLADINKHSRWVEWPVEHQDPKVAEKWIGEQYPPLKAEIDFYLELVYFSQWLLHLQWLEIKDYARSKGVSLMLPVSLAFSLYTSEIWGDQKKFRRELRELRKLRE